MAFNYPTGNARYNKPFNPIADPNAHLRDDNEGVVYAQEQYPSRKYPSGTVPHTQAHHDQEKVGIRRMIERELKREEQLKQLKDDTEKKKKLFKWPMKFKSAANKSDKNRDTVLVFFLNIKGELENPMVLPIRDGNMVLIRNKVYEVDPRAIWTFRIGMKIHKLLIIKEIDRRPVTNLDLDEVRKRGDATDSDEFIIKMALRAQQTQTAKSMSKAAIILIVIGLVAAVGFFLWKS